MEEDVFSLIDDYGAPVKKPARGELSGPKRPEEKRETAKELHFDLSKTQNRKSSATTSAAEVLKNHNHSRRDTLFSGLSGISAKEADTAGNYTLVFIVGKSDAPYGYRYANTRDPLVVHPGVQYIKKDGSPGRYESYRDNQNLLPISNTERNLLTWLLDDDSKGVPFGYVLPHLVNDPDLRIVLKKYNSYMPVSIEELQRVRVSFEFGGLQKNETPFFKPQFVFESPRTSNEPLPADSIEYGESGIGLYFYS